MCGAYGSVEYPPLVDRAEEEKKLSIERKLADKKTPRIRSKVGASTQRDA